MEPPLELQRSYGSSSRTIFSTLNEAELSESLVYLTCPICEEVRSLFHSMPCAQRDVSNACVVRLRQAAAAQLDLTRAPCMQVMDKDPVFTPCHHTFCGACIHGRLRAGDKACFECKRPLNECELQPNLMAAKLLATMRTCCIYKANGCGWKGKVKELALHFRECPFAVGRCPFGCGAAFEPRLMVSHVAVCELRQVTDCPCGTRFRHSERARHEARCLPFNAQGRKRAEGELVAMRAQTTTLQTALAGSGSRARGVQLGAAQQLVERTSGEVYTMRRVNQ